jgi:hypothetical protein
MHSTDVSYIEITYTNVRIERMVTCDHFDGSPWPPPGDGWRVVRTLDGWRHEWRRFARRRCVMKILMPAPCRRRCRSRHVELRGGRLHCVKCGADRGPLRRDTINFIQAIESRFGPITDPVVLRKGERGQ